MICTAENANNTGADCVVTVRFIICVWRVNTIAYNKYIRENKTAKALKNNIRIVFESVDVKKLIMFSIIFN